MNKEFYDTWLPYVLTIVRRYGVAEADQKDVIQDIFIRYHEKRTRYDRARGEFRAWFRTLAVNEVLQHLRRRHRYVTSDLAALSDANLAVVDRMQDLDAEYLIEMIAELPVGFRTVFNLHVIEGYSHEEIAAKLGISPVSSRSQLSRAKSRLRQRLTFLKQFAHAIF